MIWCFGQTALFLFLLAKATLAYLPIALSVAILSFWAGPVCSNFSAEACAILHALCWSWQHQQVCHFCPLLLLSDSRSVLATMSSLLSFLLSQTLLPIWQEPSSFSSCSIRLQWVPGLSFLLENDAADELARRGALLAPSAIPCSLSPLISRIHSCLFSDWRRTVSSKFFDTQVPSISTEELVILVMLTVFSRLRCNGHSLLLSSYLFRIGRIENPSCSACGHLSEDPSYLILHCSATDSLATLCLSTISCPDPGEVPGFWGPMVFRHAPILRKGGRVTTTTSGRNCLVSPVLSVYNGSPDSRFSRGTMRLMSWPDGERYLRSLQSLVVSLLSFVSTLFSDWRRTVSSKFFDTQVPSVSTEELVILVMFAVSSLVYAATDTAFC